MTNKSYIFFALPILFIGSGWFQTTKAHYPKRQKPNIIYILTDQWRASAMGYSGDPNVKTPNIDALAKSSLNFKNAVSVTPVCTPYRAALMTGRYPTSTGMFLNDLHLPDEELCVAEVFGKAGYNTGYIGKWHLDGNERFSFIPIEKGKVLIIGKQQNVTTIITILTITQETPVKKCFGMDMMCLTKQQMHNNTFVPNQKVVSLLYYL